MNILTTIRKLFSRKLKVTSYRRTGFACPSEWELNVNHKTYRVYYRHGVLLVSDESDKEIFQHYTGDYSGYMDTSEMMQITNKIFNWKCVK